MFFHNTVTDSSGRLTTDMKKCFEDYPPHDYDEGIHLTFENIVPVDREKYRSHNPPYEMEKRPHGIAVIIRIKNFTCPNLPTLEAADNDEYNLRETFRFLGYKVEVYRDCTAKEIQQIFKKIVKVRSAEFADHDSFVCCIISHGGKGRKIFANDGLKVDLNKHIASKLTACENLKRKPKMLFIQACRGGESDEGVSVTAGEASDLPEIIPNRADIFFGFATPHDYVAYTPQYESERSSAYVESLCQTFRENAKCMHLVDMHTMINRRVAADEHHTDEGIYKQMPEIQHTLRKNVYFFS